MKGDVVLCAENLTVGYTKRGKTHNILANLNFKLKRGQLVCLMGPNGIGKSTLIRTLCKSQKHLGGSIQLNSMELSEYSSKEFASNVSVVLTDSLNAGNLTVRELVSFGRYPHTNWNLNFTKEDDLAVGKAMQQAGIEELSNERTFELSDGQRQKVMIARALCQETPVIILDEPTAHLDLNNRVEVINLLKQLARDSNKAILMATHELDLALQAADELWVVGFDKNLITGFPEDLVLSGRIDKVFNLKGFDLKTGYLKKQVNKESVNIVGEGYLFLWTKNALERNGYGIDSSAEQQFTILRDENKVIWRNEKGVIFDSLENVVMSLKH